MAGFRAGPGQYNAAFNPPVYFMSSAWLLPEHIADVLPAEARRIEELRRSLLDMARGYGFELVMPPLLEHLDSLLTGTGRELDLRTFKLVDQLSGRSLGVRADSWLFITTHVPKAWPSPLPRPAVWPPAAAG